MRIPETIPPSIIKYIRSVVFICRPGGWTEFIEDIKADHLTLTKKVRCDSHLFFIAGLPKSGTTWLEQLLAHTPGLVQLNKSACRLYPTPRLDHSHDVSKDMLLTAPRDKLSFLKLHLQPSPHNFQILDVLNLKTIILIRDLRDMLVSRYFHVMAQSNHWDHNRLMGFPDEKRLYQSLLPTSPEDKISVLKYYIWWLSGWLLRYKEHPKNNLLIRFEDMKTDLPGILSKVYNFYGYLTDANQIQAVIQKQASYDSLSRNSSLKQNLQRGGRRVSTFRKGKSGEWRDAFNDEAKNIVKRFAGKLLIETGYEKDFNW